MAMIRKRPDGRWTATVIDLDGTRLTRTAQARADVQHWADWEEADIAAVLEERRDRIAGGR